VKHFDEFNLVEVLADICEIVTKHFYRLLQEGHII